MRGLALILVVAVATALAGCAAGHDAPATNVTDTSATLNGSVNDDRDATPTYWFAYGKTDSYGNETPHRTIQISDRNAHPVSEPVTGLDPDTVYHFEVCAQESGQSELCSADRTFKTDPPLSVTANPALSPDFDPSVSDYVTRCTGDPVSVTVAAPTGTTVAVNGGTARGGTFTQDVPLAEDERFDFTTTKGGNTTTFHVRCLPADFPSWKYTRTGASALDFTLAAPALYLVPAHYLAFFNTDGVPVWWYKFSGTPVDAKLLPDNTVAYGNYPGGVYEIRRLDGTLVRTVATVNAPTDFHELQLLSNGDYIVTSYKQRDHVDLSPYGGPSDTSVVDGEIQEIAPNGSLVWSWNSKDHVSLAETGRWWPTLLKMSPPYDPFHLNSVEPDGDGFLVSARHEDAVYRIVKSDGHVDWKLGGHHTAQSLTISGDPYASHLGGQHDARRLADGTVSLHDNGTGLLRAPRALRFSINPTDRTATEVESLSDSAVDTSQCCGSATKLSNGGWLVDWGGNPVVGEYAANGSLISKLTFDTFFSYRAFAVPHGRLSAATLRQGMDAIASQPAASAAPNARQAPSADTPAASDIRSAFSKH